MRYHFCWGSWHGAHVNDIPLKDIIDIALQVKAQAYSFEAGNVRHEHEWTLWRDVKLPAARSSMPGVVSHATNIVEHPELVARRIQKLRQRRRARERDRRHAIAASAAGSTTRSCGRSSRRWSKARASPRRGCGRGKHRQHQGDGHGQGKAKAKSPARTTARRRPDQRRAAAASKTKDPSRGRSTASSPAITARKISRSDYAATRNIAISA